eukprot:scaffold3009_cov108-Isochrysis_galbana.AAC.15
MSVVVLSLVNRSQVRFHDQVLQNPNLNGKKSRCKTPLINRSSLQRTPHIVHTVRLYTRRNRTLSARPPTAHATREEHREDLRFPGAELPPAAASVEHGGGGLEHPECHANVSLTQHGTPIASALPTRSQLSPRVHLGHELELFPRRHQRVCGVDAAGRGRRHTDARESGIAAVQQRLDGRLGIGHLLTVGEEEWRAVGPPLAPEIALMGEWRADHLEHHLGADVGHDLLECRPERCGPLGFEALVLVRASGEPVPRLVRLVRREIGMDHVEASRGQASVGAVGGGEEVACARIDAAHAGRGTRGWEEG